MKQTIFALLLVIIGGIPFCQAQKKVLIFSKTTGFRHKSIPKGIQVVSDILRAENIPTVATEDAAYFCTDSLKKFDAIIFLSTTGTILDADQKRAFQQFIQSGHGFVGIHAASDTEYEWPWYGELVGAYFNRHPAVQEAKIDVVDRSHLSTAHLQQVWWHKDEWYDFKNVQDGLHILLRLDESTYDGGQMGKFHPIAWFRSFDGGRMFYTGLGHTKESYDVLEFQRHIIGGVKYVLSLN
ncbi:ThuA domain-containing protein [Sphingobacterium sp. LRF_L2]|uniref:ThuA domain-containing protein n=1 Tax=Sphingobacterium sp. LRF_L2 TaxID=3369421 RepID=UPI003F61E4F9